MNEKYLNERQKQAMELFHALQRKAQQEQARRETEKREESGKSKEFHKETPPVSAKQPEVLTPAQKLARYGGDRSIDLFLRTSDSIEFQDNGQIPSQKLYPIYYQWCQGEDLFPRSPCAFGRYLCKHAQDYHIFPVNGLRGESGARVRGFRGIREKASATDATPQAITIIE